MMLIVQSSLIRLSSIGDHNVFIVQATGVNVTKLVFFVNAVVDKQTQVFILASLV